MYSAIPHDRAGPRPHSAWDTPTPARQRIRASGHVPESMTERWNHIVEAEDRFRLGRKLRGGKHRR
jgi:hypothetical protein